MIAKDFDPETQRSRWPQPRERLQQRVHGVPQTCTEFSLSESRVLRVLPSERHPRRFFSVAPVVLRELCVELLVLRAAQRGFEIVVQRSRER